MKIGKTYVTCAVDGPVLFCSKCLPTKHLVNDAIAHGIPLSIFMSKTFLSVLQLIDSNDNKNYRIPDIMRKICF